jgi:hypothetical protein
VQWQVRRESEVLGIGRHHRRRHHWRRHRFLLPLPGILQAKLQLVAGRLEGISLKGTEGGQDRFVEGVPVLKPGIILHKILFR